MAGAVLVVAAGIGTWAAVGGDDADATPGKNPGQSAPASP